MIRGRFGDTSGRPFIDGRLIVRKLGIYDYVSFCIDTGSDETVLLPVDSLRMALDFGKLKDRSDSCSLSGICSLYTVPATVQFISSECIYSYTIDLKVAPVSPAVMQLPSIIGRNIIDNWSMNYCRSKNRLNIKILSADHMIEADPIP